MPWHQGLEPFLRRSEPLSVRTTFHIGGPAAFFLEPQGQDAFTSAYAAAGRSGLPLHILGGGSNLLVSDKGVEGVVLSTARLQGRTERTGERCVRVFAGTPLIRIVRWTARNGLAGLEGLAGIPGTVGGAVHMNAGGAHGTIGERVQALWCVRKNGGTYVRNGRDVEWGYRSTDLLDPVVAVELLLDRDDPEVIQERMDDVQSQKRRSQPVGEMSAGCFFKNPRGQSAGKLIDDAGMKGARVGGAAVSTRHANFIVNLGGASADDVLTLCRKVNDRVRERFGIELETEVRCWQ